MPDLNFKVEKAEPVTHAAAPLLHFGLRVSDSENANIHAVALRCQIRIEPARRRYDAAEKDRLLDLFGQPHRWGQTLKSMLWTHTSVIVPPFVKETTVDLPVPCSADFNLAATKYFDALRDESAPLSLHFSGTVFYEPEGGPLQVAPISWEKQADFKLPVEVWKRMMDHYYPNWAWIGLHRDAFDRLHEFKRRNGLTSWEQAVEKLLDASEQETHA